MLAYVLFSGPRAPPTPLLSPTRARTHVTHCARGAPYAFSAGSGAAFTGGAASTASSA